LVLLDEEGRIAEVKKGQSRRRRVVPQLLDYAAALWAGLTVEDFECHVLRRTPRDADPRSLRNYIVDEWFTEAEDPEEAGDRTLEGLGETLRTGDFALVLAAQPSQRGFNASSST
jgi:hypothetical protein